MRLGSTRLRSSRSRLASAPLLRLATTGEATATITYEGSNGTEERDVDANDVSDSGKVDGVRLKLDDASYLHVPDARVYAVAMSEEEDRVDYSSS